MKFLLIAALGLSLNAMANKHHGSHGKMDPEMKKKWDAMSFEDAKKMKSEMLTQKKTMVEEAQKCVDSATDKDGIHKCMETMHDQKKDMHSDMKDKMKKKM